MAAVGRSSGMRNPLAGSSTPGADGGRASARRSERRTAPSSSHADTAALVGAPAGGHHGSVAHKRASARASGVGIEVKPRPASLWRPPGLSQEEELRRAKQAAVDAAADEEEEDDTVPRVSVMVVMVKDSLLRRTLHLSVCIVGFFAAALLASDVSAAWNYERTLQVQADVAEAGVCPPTFQEASVDFTFEQQRARLKALRAWIAEGDDDGFLAPGIRTLGVVVGQARFRRVRVDDATCVDVHQQQNAMPYPGKLTDIPRATEPPAAQYPVAPLTKDDATRHLCIRLGGGDDAGSATSAYTYDTHDIQGGPQVNSTAWRYTWLNDPETKWFTQDVARPLRYNRTEASHVAQELADWWIDEQTAELAVYIFFFDSQQGTFALLDCLTVSRGTDINTIGSAKATNIPSWDILTPATFWLEVGAVIAYGVYCVLEELSNVREARDYKGGAMSYFANAYNYVDAGALVCWAVSIAVVTQHLALVSRFEPNLLEAANANPHGYTAYQALKPDEAVSRVIYHVWDLQTSTFAAKTCLNVYSFLVLLQVVQATRFHPTLAVLIRSLEAVAMALVDFIAYFLALFGGFSIILFVVFGYSLRDFADHSSARWSLLRLGLLGGFPTSKFDGVSADHSGVMAVRAVVFVLVLVLVKLAPGVLLGMLFRGFGSTMAQAQAYGSNFVGELPLVLLEAIEYPINKRGTPGCARWCRRHMRAVGVPAPRRTVYTAQVKREWKRLAHFMDDTTGAWPDDIVEERTELQLRRRLGKVCAVNGVEAAPFSHEFVRYLFERNEEYKTAHTHRLLKALLTSPVKAVPSNLSGIMGLSMNKLTSDDAEAEAEAEAGAEGEAEAGAEAAETVKSLSSARRQRRAALEGRK